MRFIFSFLNNLFRARSKLSLHPFPRNANKSQIEAWFSNEPAWKKIDPRIINVFIDKLHQTPECVEVLKLSYIANLFKEYGSIKKLLREEIREIWPIVISTEITKILYIKGTISLEECFKLIKTNSLKSNEFFVHHYIANISLQSAIYIEPNFISSYLSSAVLKRLEGKNEEAKAVCKTGLMRSKTLAETISYSEDKEMINSTNEIQQKLTDLLHEL